MKNKQDTFTYSKYLYDKECEECVIGSLIKYNWAYPQEATSLSIDLFGDPLCKNCYEALVNIYQEKQDFSQVELTMEIHKVNPDIEFYDALGLTQKAFITPGQLTKHVQILIQLHCRRALVEMSHHIADRSNDLGEDLEDILGEAMEFLEKIFKNEAPGNITTLKETLKDLEHFISDRQEGKVANSGTLIGFHEIDDEGGLMPGQLVVIGAESAHGKSAMALTWTKNIINQNIPIAYFSLEMSTRSLTARLLSMESGVTATKQIHPTLTLENEDYIQVAQALGRMEKVGENLFFKDKFTASLEHICASIRSMQFRYGIRGVFIDYLQILNSTQNVSNREQYMGEVARKLKNLAVELNVWIVTLSQLNRNDYKEEPTLHRLRDSGQIAEAADRVMLIYRPEANNKQMYSGEFKEVSTHNTALIKLAKNRNGETASFIVNYIPEQTLFQPCNGDYPHCNYPGTTYQHGLQFHDI